MLSTWSKLNRIFRGVRFCRSPPRRPSVTANSLSLVGLLTGRWKYDFPTGRTASGPAPLIADAKDRYAYNAGPFLARRHAPLRKIPSTMRFSHHRLENGLQVVIENNSASHSLSLGFFVNTGARDESDDIAGVSHFLEHMLFKGTHRRSAEQVNEEFDELGAHYNAFTNEEHTVYFASLLPENQSPALDLMCDIMRPSLRVEDFSLEQQVILEEIQMYDDQPPFGADERIRAEFFAGHPLARSVLGTLESVGGLNAERMRGYFDRRYRPDNMLFAATGRVDEPALLKELARLTSSWRPSGETRSIVPVRGSFGESRLEKEGATQQYLLRLCNAPSVEDEDRHAAKLIAMALGDDVGSRMYWDLVDAGLAEHASFSHHEFHGAGVFMTSLSCMPPDIDACRERLDELAQTAMREGLAPEEIERAKAKAASRLVLAGEKTSSRLFAVGLEWLQRQEYQSIQDDMRIVQGITVDQANAVLAKYPLEPCRTLVVASA